MTSPWPSDGPSQGGGRGRAPRGQRVPTDWLSGWIVAAVWAVVTVALAAVLWPFAATALESVQLLTETLSTATRNQV